MPIFNQMGLRMTDELLDIEVLREEFPWIPRNTWYHWRATGKGPKSARLGRRVVYRRSDVDAWVEAAFEAAE